MTSLKLSLAAVACVALTPAFAPQALVAQSMAHRHIGHVADQWNDTPDNMGLLAAAMAEAEIAAQHASLAAEASDLEELQRHIMHVVHAIDAAMAEGGPGKGYGLIKAASGAARHITLAAEADDASDAVKTHANHVSTSAQNVVMWAESVLEKASAVADATDMAMASEAAAEIAMMTQAIVSGTDADGDGRVSWGEGEGGLAQAATHLRLMKEAEDLS